METRRIALGALAATLLILVNGCKHDDTLKPPKEDAVYRLPPSDSRYTQYPGYPERTLNDFPKRDPDAVQQGPPGAGGSRSRGDAGHALSEPAGFIPAV